MFAFYKLYLLGYHLIQSSLQTECFSLRGIRSCGTEWGVWWGHAWGEVERTEEAGQAVTGTQSQAACTRPWVPRSLEYRSWKSPCRLSRPTTLPLLPHFKDSAQQNLKENMGGGYSSVAECTLGMHGALCSVSSTSNK